MSGKKEQYVEHEPGSLQVGSPPRYIFNTKSSATHFRPVSSNPAESKNPIKFEKIEGTFEVPTQKSALTELLGLKSKEQQLPQPTGPKKA